MSIVAMQTSDNSEQSTSSEVESKDGKQIAEQLVSKSQKDLTDVNENMDLMELLLGAWYNAEHPRQIIFLEPKYMYETRISERLLTEDLNDEPGFLLDFLHGNWYNDECLTKTVFFQAMGNYYTGTPEQLVAKDSTTGSKETGSGNHPEFLRGFWTDSKHPTQRIFFEVKGKYHTHLQDQFIAKDGTTVTNETGSGDLPEFLRRFWKGSKLPMQTIFFEMKHKYVTYRYDQLDPTDLNSPTDVIDTLFTLESVDNILLNAELVDKTDGVEQLFPKDMKSFTGAATLSQVQQGKQPSTQAVSNNVQKKAYKLTHWFLPTDLKALDDAAEPGDLLEFDRGTHSHWSVYIGVKNTDGYVTDLDSQNYKNRLSEITGTSRVRINNAIDALHKPALNGRDIIEERSRTFLHGTSDVNCLNYAVFCRCGIKLEQPDSLYENMVKTVCSSSVAAVTVASGITGFLMKGGSSAAVGLAVGASLSLAVEALPKLLKLTATNYTRQHRCFHTGPHICD